MKTKITCYIDTNNEWCVERDGEDWWIRAPKDGYQMVDEEFLKALKTAIEFLLGTEVCDG